VGHTAQGVRDMEQSMKMSTATIIVCDDEELIRWSLCAHLEQEGFQAIPVADGKACLSAVRDSGASLVMLDLKMPVMDGMTTLRKLRESGNDIPVIVLTAHGGLESAVEATKLGASDFLAKPFDLREITIVVKRTLDEDRLRHEVHHLRRRREGYGAFIGTSKSLVPMFETLRRLEEVDPPTILILGGSGTGKDLLARAIHARGPRSDNVFMEVDCAAMPEQLIESTLFGHERGAFTDAKTMSRGLFEVAGNGVVFLDEIGEMSLATQAKLLRAVENRAFKRVGGSSNIPLRAAIVAATNRDLKGEVQAGRFREDLYFRLNVVPILIPNLSQRADDIPALVHHFVERFSRSFGRRIDGVTGEAMQTLQKYSWPGNVRELRNVLERAVLLSKSEIIDANDLPPEIRYAGTSSRTDCPFILPEDGVDLEAVERGLLQQALDRTGGNQSAAARLLGISRYALRYRMEKYGTN
jgi:two-component system, NtrC family, response regulator AtoC